MGPRRSAAAVAVALAMAGCSDPATSSDDGRLRIVTTVAPITSIVASIGGDRVRVTGLVPEGQNSHTFEPPPSAAEVISRADLVIVNGLKLEDPTAELARQNKKKGAAVVALGDRVLPRDQWIYDFSFPAKDGKPNPHLWTDPKYAVRYAQAIHDEYVARDPDGRTAYDANLAAFTKGATALDR